MKPEIILESQRIWEEQPEKAKIQPMVKARSEGAQAVLKAGPFTWRADLPLPLGGANEAPSPVPLLLGALAGCAVVLIRDTLAPQLGVRVEAVEATAQCEADLRGALAMEGVAPDIQNIQLNIEIQSPESEDKVQKLYQAWQERCPIYLALLKSLPVTTTLEVKGG